MIIDIPSIEEQNKISMLLNNVNSIITLHQRKLDKLQDVKKGVASKDVCLVLWGCVIWLN